MTGLPFEYAVRNLGRSRLRLALLVAGSALVVLLVLVAGGFVRGMSAALRATGDPRNVILLGAGSEESAERSEIEAATPGLVEASVPGIRTEAGVAFVSPQVTVMLPVGRGGLGDEHGRQAILRGVTPSAFLVHERVRLLEGRLPAPGADELLVGRMAATAIRMPESALRVGETLEVDGRPWTIVGRFTAPGTVFDAEIWTALDDLMTAVKRTTISSVVISLDPSEAEFADVSAFTKMRPDLELVALSESEYYGQLEQFFQPIRAVVWTTAGLVAVGALLGGLNTMYAAFAARIREFGTLRALGFRRRAILQSLVKESLLAVAAGALLAAAVAILLLDGLSVRFSMGAFGLVIDAPVLALGLAVAAVLGVVGALQPGLRCVAMPIPGALKAV